MRPDSNLIETVECYSCFVGVKALNDILPTPLYGINFLGLCPGLSPLHFFVIDEVSVYEIVIVEVLLFLRSVRDLLLCLVLNLVRLAVFALFLVWLLLLLLCVRVLSFARNNMGVSTEVHLAKYPRLLHVIVESLEYLSVIENLRPLHHLVP